MSIKSTQTESHYGGKRRLDLSYDRGKALKSLLAQLAVYATTLVPTAAARCQGRIQNAQSLYLVPSDKVGKDNDALSWTLKISDNKESSWLQGPLQHALPLELSADEGGTWAANLLDCYSRESDNPGDKGAIRA